MTADFSPMVILSRETDLPPPLELFLSVLTDLSPSASLSTVTETFCELEPETRSLSLSEANPLSLSRSLSRSDPEGRSRSLSAPELLFCSLSEPCNLSPPLPGLSRDMPFSADDDRSFLLTVSAVLLVRSPSEVLDATDRSEVDTVFSGPDGVLSEGGVSVLPFLPRSRFSLILLWTTGFT